MGCICCCCGGSADVYIDRSSTSYTSHRNSDTRGYGDDIARTSSYTSQPFVEPRRSNDEYDSPYRCSKTSDDRYNERRGQIRDEFVNCSPYVGHGDVARFTNVNYDCLTDLERLLLQETMTLVTYQSRWIMENVEVTVYGERMQTLVVFYSGHKTNKFVVHLKDNKPSYVTVAMGWRLRAQQGVVKIWEFIKSVPSDVFGAISSGVKALGWP